MLLEPDSESSHDDEDNAASVVFEPDNESSDVEDDLKWHDFVEKFTALEGSMVHFRDDYSRVDVNVLLRLPRLNQRIVCLRCGFLGHATPRANASAGISSCPGVAHRRLCLTPQEQQLLQSRLRPQRPRRKRDPEVRRHRVRSAKVKHMERVRAAMREAEQSGLPGVRVELGQTTSTGTALHRQTHIDPQFVQQCVQEATLALEQTPVVCAVCDRTIIGPDETTSEVTVEDIPDIWIRKLEPSHGPTHVPILSTLPSHVLQDKEHSPPQDCCCSCQFEFEGPLGHQQRR
jgi:hypothetical protein